MASRPLRVLAMAVREDFTGDKDLETYKGGASTKLQEPSNFERIERNLIFEGVCGIKDPARPEVKPAIEACATAGIRVIMITGDTRPTAEAIAREIGILRRRKILQEEASRATTSSRSPRSSVLSCSLPIRDRWSSVGRSQG